MIMEWTRGQRGHMDIGIRQYLYKIYMNMSSDKCPQKLA